MIFQSLVTIQGGYMRKTLITIIALVMSCLWVLPASAQVRKLEKLTKKFLTDISVKFLGKTISELSVEQLFNLPPS